MGEKKFQNKIISILVTLSMLFALLPTNAMQAFADEEDSQEPVVVAEAEPEVETPVDLELINTPVNPDPTPAPDPVPEAPVVDEPNGDEPEGDNDQSEAQIENEVLPEEAGEEGTPEMLEDVPMLMMLGEELEVNGEGTGITVNSDTTVTSLKVSKGLKTAEEACNEEDGHLKTFIYINGLTVEEGKTLTVDTNTIIENANIYGCISIANGTSGEPPVLTELIMRGDINLYASGSIEAAGPETYFETCGCESISIGENNGFAFYYSPGEKITNPDEMKADFSWDTENYCWIKNNHDFPEGNAIRVNEKEDFVIKYVKNSDTDFLDVTDDITLGDGDSSVTLEIKRKNQDDARTPFGVRIGWLEGENYHESAKALDNNGRITISKSDLGAWYSISVKPLDDNQYIFDGCYDLNAIGPPEFGVTLKKNNATVDLNNKTFVNSDVFTITANNSEASGFVEIMDSTDLVELTFTRNQNTSTATYTATSSKGFRIIVYESSEKRDYDQFFDDDETYVVEFGTEIEEGCSGTVSVNVANDKKISFGNETKIRLSRNNNNQNTVEFTLNPGANSQIEVFEITNQGLNSADKTSMISNNKFTYVYHDNVEEQPYLIFRFCSPGGGQVNDPQGNNWNRLSDELSEGYFAYGDVNSQDGKGEPDANDLKFGLAYELYSGFQYGYNNGRYQNEGMQLGLAAHVQNEALNESNSNILAIKNAITVTADASKNISAKDINGTSHTIAYYDFTVDLKNISTATAEQKQALSASIGDTTFTGKVYAIPTIYTGDGKESSSKNIIIKVGNEYFIRSTQKDNQNIGLSNENSGVVLVISDQLDTSSAKPVIVFGNTAALNGEVLSDSSAQSFYVANVHGQLNDFGTKLAVYKNGFAGVVLAPEGSKEAAAWDTNSTYAIQEIGENASTKVFFGYRTVKIQKGIVCTNGSVSQKSITAVAIADSTPSNAVTVTSGENGIFTIQFLSDYYDSVKFKVTYEGGIEKFLTINRVGIVINHSSKSGDSGDIKIFHGHQSSTQAISDKQYAVYATYYFPSSAASASGDVALYVTVTRANGSTESKVLVNKIYTGETGENAAMADFLIFEGTRYDASQITKVEAIAIPKADASGHYKGAKFGAGKGVSSSITIVNN